MLLEMTGISKSFGSNRVLEDVSFQLQEGEVVALLGANGAGKSTLMKIVTGIYQRDAGTIHVADKIVTVDSPADAMRHGIRLVPQELQILPDLSVAENIFLGALPTNGTGALASVQRNLMDTRAKAILGELGIAEMDVTLPLSKYSTSEQRLVEIARALAKDAKILVLDEPTASLSAPECDRLFAAMEKLRKRGVAIIFISHFLDEVFRVCDRIVVLRDGKNSGAFVTKDTDHSEVLAAMLGRELTDLFPERDENYGEEIFSASKLCAPPRIHDVSFSVKKGEIHGIFGLIGSGIEEIGRVLFGQVAPKSGSLELFGERFEPKTVIKSIEAGLGFVSGERKSEGIIPDLSLRDNFTIPFLSRHTFGVTVRDSSQSEFAEKWINALGVVTSGVEQKIGTLSGGNQQKVCIGRWLVDDLRLLILEEPTRGVDLGARKDIYAHLRNLTKEGLSIIVISSDAEEIGGLADSSTVLIDGVVTRKFTATATARELMHAATRGAAA